MILFIVKDTHFTLEKIVTREQFPDEYKRFKEAYPNCSIEMRRL